VTTPNPRSVQPDPSAAPCYRWPRECTHYDDVDCLQAEYLPKPVDPRDLTRSQRDALVAGFDRLLDPDGWEVVAE
jgi:hypothetical protein